MSKRPRRCSKSHGVTAAVQFGRREIMDFAPVSIHRVTGIHNGNKRTALVAMLAVLDKNGLMLLCEEDELFKLVLLVAQHKIVEPAADYADREVSAIAEWIYSRCRSIEKGDFVIPFRRLRRILSRLECGIEIVSGSCANISRTRTITSGIFNRERTYTLVTQISYNSEGAEVAKNTIAKVRKELQLDDDHNIDSKTFYGTQPLPTSEFIETYRKTLRRLSRM
jgi:death-on-curing protein